MWQEMEYNGKTITFGFDSSGEPHILLDDDVLCQTVDEMQISKEVKDYLHKIGIKNGEDFVDRQHELPKKYKAIVGRWLLRGEPTE